MQKIERNYKAIFEIGRIDGGLFYAEESLTIQYPFTVEFDVNVGTYGAPNVGVFQFYNLNKQDQAKLWVDMYNLGKKYVIMSFYAGYGDDMPLIFSGKVMSGDSFRDSGSVDTITTIQVMGGFSIFKYGYANSTYQAGTKYSNVIASLLSNIPKATVGYLSDSLPKLARNQSFMGQTLDLLKRELSGYNIYEEQGELHVLKDKDVIPGDIITITEKSGLLGTPRRAEQSLEVTTIFEPGLRCSQLVYLSSQYELIKNQTYKIVAIHHHGVISPVISGNLTTTCTLWYGDIETEWSRINKKGVGSTTAKVSSTKWQKPVKNGHITSSFGWRIHPIFKTKKYHDGIDISASLGEPVYATESGYVVTAEVRGGYGNFILIAHGKDNDGNTLSSAYGHLKDWKVTSGQNVNKGDIIGTAGTSGNSTGPHLHFEVRKNQQPVNPTLYIGGF